MDENPATHNIFFTAAFFPVEKKSIFFLRTPQTRSLKASQLGCRVLLLRALQPGIDSCEPQREVSVFQSPVGLSRTRQERKGDKKKKSKKHHKRRKERNFRSVLRSSVERRTNGLSCVAHGCLLTAASLWPGGAAPSHRRTQYNTTQHNVNPTTQNQDLCI